MGFDISRESYVDSEDARTGRGLTYDLFTSIHNKVNRMDNRVKNLEQRTLWFYLSNVKGKISLRMLLIGVLFICSLVAGKVNADNILQWLKFF